MPRQIVLVSGATGKQGLDAAAALLDSSQTSSLDIRFLTRNPESSSASRLTKRSAKAFKANILDGASLGDALQGVSTAFLLTDNVSGGVEKEGEMGKTFIDEAKKVEIKHSIFTSVGASHIVIRFPTPILSTK